ncbi:MAG: hypothetical protein F9K22_13850 [Bacteroidetes bacterium]|nr:MAG: hypothetical protein F9K22_13850 [Bacteroidota bacterium]
MKLFLVGEIPPWQMHSAGESNIIPMKKPCRGDRQGFRVVRVRLSREVVPRRRNPALADAFGGRIEHHPNEKALPG